MINSNIQFIVIDLFCGAGGTTTGFEQSGVCKVIACINHDENAIKSHKANHPDCFHAIEDIRHFNIHLLLPIIEKARIQYPRAKLVVFASAECTNFSDAKGGLPRDADSRSLPNHLISYNELLRPDYFMVENVREFMAWGELDEKGKPVSRKKGIYYLRWVKAIQDLGYDYDFRILNAADFGAYQSRERYFGIFAKHGLPITFPRPTHAKKAQKGTMFRDSLNPHKAVREVLDLHDIGASIFRRKKNHVDKTLTRILRGLQKFKDEQQPFLMRNNTPGFCYSTDRPCGTITTKDTNYIISPTFLHGYFGNPDNNPRVKSLNDAGPTVVTHGRYGLCSIMRHYGSEAKDKGVSSLENPAPTVTASGTCSVIGVQFLQRYFKDGGHPASLEKPCGTLTTVENTALVTAHHFLDRQFGNGTPTSIEKPSPTLTTIEKTALASWVFNPQYSNNGSSINDSAPTVIARQDKKPLGLATAVFSDIPDYLYPADHDSEVMIQLKAYCRENGIADVFLRMLNERELKRIQGFPSDYTLIGTSAERKKYIGNAVEVTMAKCLALGLAEGFNFIHSSKVA
jgi:DNA (cytosine-5)-methyltransferase 1